jgi:hypothetical protein
MAMPVPQRLMRQETRVLKNIPGDIYHGIVTETDLRFYEEFVWQKQTSKLMLGAGRRPRPGNNIACNTTERITVYVKSGKPRKFPTSVVAANEITGDQASDEPLSSVVAWWRTTYREWREPRKAAGIPHTLLSENESMVLGLGAVYSVSPSDEELTEDIKDPDVQRAWGYVRQARDALRGAQA